ncbi:hypothetical protein CDD81_3724 [Ophiocordyceps australis]|uniref:Uncharacterized protein n=1 Tax=Ophiocordyceps australis TaxID=1399860 RepID=A0A2C5Y834_9HYPO|nr:hypothetical protein CDD81_3724 [Ophiocordyceps australis]
MDSISNNQKEKKSPFTYSIQPAIRPVSSKTPSYFWAEDRSKGPKTNDFPIHRGYTEARSIIKDGRLDVLEQLSHIALQSITQALEGIDSSKTGCLKNLAEVRLSDDLQRWRQEQHAIGNILPGKGHGITPTSDLVLRVLNVENWPKPLTTTNTLYGAGMMNMLNGAYDPETLYSNYVTDVAFYYEHGYHKVFPEFEDLIKTALEDQHALRTPGGAERRAAVEIGMKYIRGKMALEERYQDKLANKVARLDRRHAQIVFFFESSLLGMGREAMGRGYDAAAVMSDMVHSSPGTDVIDVGSDMINSEMINSLLITADMTSTGIVSEEALRRVYDAYAHTGARILTQRFSEPLGRMCAGLYSWHIQNDRHCFLRRAILGYPKARKTKAELREADFDEAFDSDMRTTGLSRPLQGACSGEERCDQVEMLLTLHAHGDADGLLSQLWWLLVTGPLQYVSGGVVDAQAELDLAERLRLCMAQLYSCGLIDEMTWLLAHATHHAWQVNRLFEAAMFGSLLDDGSLQGKLDRSD